jgi:hypothetical protein
MDLIHTPVSIISEPIKLDDTLAKTVKISMDDNVLDIIRNKRNKNYRIEIRGLALNNVPFKNSWPNFGDMSLNGAEWQHSLSLPEREQSRKRKDDPLDMTAVFRKSGSKNHTLVLKKKKTPSNQKKNDDKNKYVIAVYLVQVLEIPQILEYHKKFELESFLNTYNMISERLFPEENDNDCNVVSDELKVPIRCPITLTEIKIPAKGYQ